MKILVILVFLVISSIFSQGKLLQKVEKPFVFSDGILFSNKNSVSFSLSSGLLHLEKSHMSITKNDVNLLAFQFNAVYYYYSWVFIKFRLLTASDNNVFKKGKIQRSFNHTSFGMGLSYKIKRFAFYIGSNVIILNDQKLIEKSSDIEENSDIEEIAVSRYFYQKDIGITFRLNSFLYIFSSWQLEIKHLFKFVESFEGQQNFIDLGVAFDILNFKGMEYHYSNGFIIFSSVKVALQKEVLETSVNVFQLGIGVSF